MSADSWASSARFYGAVVDVMKWQLNFDQSPQHPFDLAKSLNGTQDFRWRKLGYGWYSGVLGGNPIHIRQSDHGVEYRAHSELNALLSAYFRLDDEIEVIYACISSRDDNVAGLVKEYPNLRIMRQSDPWECMVAYICSSNNNVDRISKIVEKIAGNLGTPVELDGEVRNTFPTPELVLEAGVGPLEELGLGLGRHSKIVDAAQRICDGKLDLSRLAQPQVPYAEAKGQLMECHGIGPKVADCIALFSLDKMEAFPVDVHVRRAVEGYFQSRDWPTDKSIVKWAQDRFGEYAGYANQFLFHQQFNAQQ